MKTYAEIRELLDAELTHGLDKYQTVASLPDGITRIRTVYDKLILAYQGNERDPVAPLVVKRLLQLNCVTLRVLTELNHELKNTDKQEPAHMR